MNTDVFVKYSTPSMIKVNRIFVHAIIMLAFSKRCQFGTYFFLKITCPSESLNHFLKSAFSFANSHILINSVY